LKWKYHKIELKISCFLSQKKYVKELFSKFNISGDKPIYSPSIQDVCLEKNTEQVELKDTNLY